MSLRPLAALLILLVAPSLAGCGNLNWGRQSQAANADSRAQGSGSDSQSVPVPASQFTDIPVPTNARLVLDRTLVLGARDEWTGRAFFETPFNVSDLFDFYKREMPNFGWTEISSARSESSVIVFARVTRIATIHILGTSLFSSGATVNMLIAPGSTSITTSPSAGPGSPMTGGSSSSIPVAPGPAGGAPAPVRMQQLR